MAPVARLWPTQSGGLSTFHTRLASLSLLCIALQMLALTWYAAYTPRTPLGVIYRLALGAWEVLGGTTPSVLRAR